MANIRDYLKEREKRQGNPQLINYKEKIRGHKLTVFYRVVLAVVVVAAVIAFLVIAWRDMYLPPAIPLLPFLLQLYREQKQKILMAIFFFIVRMVPAVWITKARQSGTSLMKCSLLFYPSQVQSVHWEIIMEEKYMSAIRTGSVEPSIRTFRSGA